MTTLRAAVRSAIVLIAAAAIVPSVAAGQDVRDDSGALAIGFDDPRTCAPNAALDRLLGFISPGDADASAVDLSQQLGGTLTRRIDFADPELWHGLSITAVEVVQGIESGPSNLLLFFAEPPGRALERLRDAGFPLTDVDVPLRRDVGVESGIVLTRDGPGSVLTCYSD